MVSNPFLSIFMSYTWPLGERLGFRYGDKGTHSSRTIMLKELQLLLDALPGKVECKDYVSAVLDENCLGKRTSASRKLSFQRLRELYALDAEILLFRVMRDLWGINPPDCRPLLALLLALARDPLLRITAAPVLETPFGKEFARQSMTDALSI